MLRFFIRAIGLLLICATGLAGLAHADDDTNEINRLFSSGHAGDAFARLDKLLAARPRDAQLRFLKGVLLSQSQRREEAIAVFERLTVDYPDMPEPYNNLAVIYAAQGQYDKARASLEAALRARPAYAVAEQNLGDVYVQLARIAYEQALMFDRANTSVPPKLAALRDLVKPITPAPAASAAASK